jgi:hypothetical protein
MTNNQLPIIDRPIGRLYQHIPQWPVDDFLPGRESMSAAMRTRLSYPPYGAGYRWQTKLLYRDIPRIGGLVLNDRGNLSRHPCRVAHLDMPDLAFIEAEYGPPEFHAADLRSVCIEVGEPSLRRGGLRRKTPGGNRSSGLNRVQFLFRLE